MHTNIIQNILGVPGILLKPNQENIRTSLQLLRPRKYPQEYLWPGFYFGYMFVFQITTGGGALLIHENAKEIRGIYYTQTVV